MADEITLQMEGNTCTISIPEDTYIGRVKIYAPRRQFPVLTHTRRTATIQLLPGETMEVDAYGEGGEGELLKTSFVLTEQGLVEQKSGVSRDDVEVIVKPTAQSYEPPPGGDIESIEQHIQELNESERESE